MKTSFRRSGSVAVAALALAWSAAANASVIEEQTRYYNAGVPDAGNNPADVTAADYISNWAALVLNAPTPGYGATTVADWNNIASLAPFNTDIASLYTVTFYVADAGVWNFRTSIDSGWGGTLLVDNQELQTNGNNMWWGGSWSDPAQYLAGSIDLSVGYHTLTAYGLEDCCNGGGNGQFEAPGGTFTNFSYDDGLPEPSSLALVGVGLAALAGVRLRARVAR